jgi:hypothetical protein
VVRQLIEMAVSSGLPTPEEQAAIKKHIRQRQAAVSGRLDIPLGPQSFKPNLKKR